MLKQHAHLVSEENRLLRDEVDRYRKHVTKLIDMHNDAALERDKLRIKLRDADSRISDLLRDACNSWATDLHVLLKAVYGGRAPISVLTVNWGALDDLVHIQGADFQMDGVTITQVAAR
ncbi:Uncharacterized protein ALO42_01093 [Pseudomonas syringae pv. atrofaciens]|uniref:Uncharacterized protein n=1 Tax=Pseudomonas syringae pv. atrofaciens TaxID=192087 RepID=A0A0P9IP10_PSESX|nr:hypothetical protein DA456_04820 [Pseudomonas syringae pv. atrofaciens]KPW11338.1 Uncharacterized protein ALO42_01093 [Pseudomonas syringae pv. atrofaciens]RMP57422.1 hypothetical protein ALQ20_03382 [Pseudomonas syringae pv. atrofaciens]